MHPLESTQPLSLSPAYKMSLAEMLIKNQSADGASDMY